jgi:hypothetical protein
LGTSSQPKPETAAGRIFRAECQNAATISSTRQSTALMIVTAGQRERAAARAARRPNESQRRDSRRETFHGHSRQHSGEAGPQLISPRRKCSCRSRARRTAVRRRSARVSSLIGLASSVARARVKVSKRSLQCHSSSVEGSPLREYNGGEVLRVQRVSIKRKIKIPRPSGKSGPEGAAHDCCYGDRPRLVAFASRDSVIP